ncbi:hypothetical protein HFP57_12220 [Parasphingopyxis algicola]|uniref:hypothetical protein n=1 Tax=Parasphingopyxis algicola TaxID=2026624 RepID=UPI00159FFEAB|nr:hypothetical protein [Parasphingopyxis algicola]QLC25707.1 hypothetical protein HFP57_12220 [Parasphingopyxis algicola]
MNHRETIVADTKKSLARLAACGAALTFLAIGSAASATSNGSGQGGVSSVARASATIVNPTSLRTAELQSVGTDFGRASGLAVTPAAVVHRDCADERAQQRCNLVILDMP